MSCLQRRKVKEIVSCLEVFVYGNTQYTMERQTYLYERGWVDKVLRPPPLTSLC